MPLSQPSSSMNQFCSLLSIQYRFPSHAEWTMTRDGRICSSQENMPFFLRGHLQRCVDNRLPGLHQYSTVCIRPAVLVRLLILLQHTEWYHLLNGLNTFHYCKKRFGNVVLGIAHRVPNHFSQNPVVTNLDAYQKNPSKPSPWKKWTHVFSLKTKSNRPSYRSILLLGSQHIFSSEENVPACNMYITISVADGLLWVIIKSQREITDPIPSWSLVSPQF